MNVELTPRSIALIAREQRKHGATSPELLIEQALEAYAEHTVEPAWFHATQEDHDALLREGISDLRLARAMPSRKS